MTQRREALRLLTTEDPLLNEKPAVTEENGMTVIQVGYEMEPKNSDLKYIEDKYANPMKTAVDVETAENLQPSLEVGASLLADHRKALKDLCR